MVGKLSIVQYSLIVKIISIDKNDMEGIICRRGKSEEKNCEDSLINAGLAGLVKVCKRKYDVIYS